MTSGQAGILTLSAGDAEVDIAPAIGGSLAGFRWRRGAHAIDWLRPTTPDALSGGDAGDLACFPLVPYSNRVRGGRFTFGGRVVTLPIDPVEDPHFQHGHGCRHPWSVIERDGAAAVLSYAHAADAWPWAYTARQSLRLVDGALHLELAVTNDSDRIMPLGLGFHPYFPSGRGGRLRATVDAMWAIDGEVLPTEVVPLRPNADPRRGLDLDRVDLDNVFTGWNGRAEISWPEIGAALAIEADPPLDFLVIYVPASQGFFCAEPVSNATDAFNLVSTGQRDTGMIELAPGATRRARTRLIPRLTTPHQ